ncbi:transporter substrate-binding domain-containing protein [Sneathiella sp. P13V-1]|uniref:substrate-binding periplasmic protein n=1 Tax=Sneathiella sp. P13V-1 TaxID=2697366 RepID=UPI00187BAFB9|nr:transporter substrate-binding domain-containing protein [Sneathiella sp. P13V-1]MBE7637921.1 transporter substrate-binding domain-containing protein [Sneathiella sp. P13V-1]
MPKLIYGIVSLIGVLFSPQVIAGEQKVICRAENHFVHKEASKTVEKIYTQLGYKVVFKDFPNRRALQLAAAGHCDGEVGRIPSAPAKYPTLNKTDKPIITIKAYAYSLRKEVNVESWDDLMHMDVAIVRGELYAERNVKARKTFYAENYIKLFELLNLRRVQVVVGLSEGVKQLTLHTHVRRSEAPLFSSHLYHLVHKKNADLLARVNDAMNMLIN